MDVTVGSVAIPAFPGNANTFSHVSDWSKR